MPRILPIHAAMYIIEAPIHTRRKPPVPQYSYLTDDALEAAFRPVAPAALEPVTRLTDNPTRFQFNLMEDSDIWTYLYNADYEYQQGRFLSRPSDGFLDILVYPNEAGMYYLDIYKNMAAPGKDPELIHLCRQTLSLANDFEYTAPSPGVRVLEPYGIYNQPFYDHNLSWMSPNAGRLKLTGDVFEVSLEYSGSYALYAFMAVNEGGEKIREDDKIFIEEATTDIWTITVRPEISGEHQIDIYLHDGDDFFWCVTIYAEN